MLRNLVLTGCVWGCLFANANAEMLSSSRNQIGTAVAGSPGRLVYLATFSYPSQFQSTASITQMRLRAWIEQSGGSAPPQVLLTQSGSNPLDMFSGPSLMLQNIGVSPLSNNFVAEYQSPWMNLSSQESQRISSLVASNSSGSIDAYLYSPTDFDFSAPTSSTTWVGNPRRGLTMVVNYYTTTLELSSSAMSATEVPEPAMAVAFGLGAVSLGLIRKRLQRKQKS
jgi:hypothetical protein